jgi:nicotinic acid phosphoribosyltransferase
MTLKELYNNKILFTDAYNLSHQRLKINTDWEVSHVYNRTRPMILYGFNEIVNTLFSKPITAENITEAEILFERHGLDWTSKYIFEDVVNKFSGYPPLKIDALPDGTYVPRNTPFAQISNSVEGFGELVTWFESVLLHCQFPSGCATKAFHMRRYLEQNNLNRYKFHSFASRSYNSMEDSYWGSSAWNLFLFGTDDCMSFIHTNAPVTSIAALAHKVVQQFDNELECYIHAIDVMKEGKALSMVIDTYDPYRFIEKYQQILVDRAIYRNVALVFRPDSGKVFDQAVSIMNNLNYLKEMIDMNSYNKFNIIIGEGMTPEKCIEYDKGFKKLGFDVNKFFYGIGGGFHRDVDRDYTGIAEKTAYSNGKPRMKTSADAMKISLPGMVQLELINNNVVCSPKEFMYVEQKSRTPSDTGTNKNMYQTVYLNNEFGINSLFIETWDDIYNRVNQLDFTAPLQEEIIYSPEMTQVINRTKEYIKTV